MVRRHVGRRRQTISRAMCRGADRTPDVHFRA
jgi:hypothetical protein